MRTTLDNRNPIANLEHELIFQGFSPHTVKLYLYYNKKFLDFIQKSSKEVNNQDIRKFVKKQKSTREQSLAISALRFYYNQILKRRFPSIRHPRQERKAKEEISKEQIKRIIQKTDNPKHKAILALKSYSKLTTKQIILLEKDDFLAKTSQIIIDYGKKQEKTRDLSQNTGKILKNWLKLAKNTKNPYIFPGMGNKSHLSMRGIQKILKITKIG